MNPVIYTESDGATASEVGNRLQLNRTLQHQDQYRLHVHPHHHHHHAHHHHQHHHHSSLSQPCLPVSNVGPTRILPFLFLGSQTDSLSRETMTQNGISYVLNVSTSSPKPSFIPDKHFLRIPVNDSYSDKLTPFFHKAFHFIDKVREANGCVLVHCLAGISRSPTLAIAYVMRALNMTSDDAYRYVKDKRPTISPNFNFLGQLLEFEKEMHRRSPPNGNAFRSSGVGIGNDEDDDNLFAAIANIDDGDENIDQNIGEAVVKKQRVELNFEVTSGVQPLLSSPTTALSRLHFGGQLSPLREHPSPPVDAGGNVVVDAAVEPTPMSFESGRRPQQRPLSPLVVNGRTMDSESRATAPAAAFEPVVIRLGSKHCHGTLKRPLSEPMSSFVLPLPVPDVELEVPTGGRRPLARPRSIILGSTIKPEQPGGPAESSSSTLSPAVSLKPLPIGRRSPVDYDDDDVRQSNKVVRQLVSSQPEVFCTRSADRQEVRDVGGVGETVSLTDCDKVQTGVSKIPVAADQSIIHHLDTSATASSSSIVPQPCGTDQLASTAARRSRSLGDITDRVGPATHDEGVGVPTGGGVAVGEMDTTGSAHNLSPVWRSFLSPTAPRPTRSATAHSGGGCRGAGDASGRRSGSGTGLSSMSNSVTGSRNSLLDSPEIIQVS